MAVISRSGRYDTEFLQHIISEMCCFVPGRHVMHLYIWQCFQWLADDLRFLEMSRRRLGCGQAPLLLLLIERSLSISIFIECQIPRRKLYCSLAFPVLSQIRIFNSQVISGDLKVLFIHDLIFLMFWWQIT